jgi:glycosyltransferase involved in cell wall biosynthesis
LLTVIVPVYNEAPTVAELLCRILAAPYHKQVVVVDDGSTDGTSSIVAGWKDVHGFLILRHSVNRGKGAAIRSGLEHALGRFTVIQDADLEYDPEDYPQLIEPLLLGKAKAVYGSRRLADIGWWRNLGNPFYHGVSLLNLCVRLLYGTRVTDEATCLKAFPTDVLRQMELTSERFEFCAEVTAKACRLGLKILEVPIRYHGRNRHAGKKIHLRDGWAALAALWKWRHWRPACWQSADASVQL